MLNVQKALSTEDMMATLQENNKNLLSITTDFKTISGRLANGEGSVGKLLKDESLANRISERLRSRLYEMTEEIKLAGVPDFRTTFRESQHH